MPYKKQDKCILSPEVYNKLRKYSKEYSEGNHYYPYMFMLGQHPKTKVITIATAVPPDRTHGGCDALPSLTGKSLAKAVNKIIKQHRIPWGLARCGDSDYEDLQEAFEGLCATLSVTVDDEDSFMIATNKFGNKIKVGVKKPRR